MKRGNIAVFITGLDSEVWKSILGGIEERAREEDYNVSIFSCAGSYDIRRKFDIGEFNIFCLANLKNFDGIITVANTIICKEVERELFDSVKNSGVPCISLEIKEDGMGFVGIDNYASMREMIEHLIDFHKYERIGFVTGPALHQESMLRRKAYEDALREHDMPVREEDIYNGNYGFQSGVDAGVYFAGSPAGLPRAIACSNDEMAMGLIRGLERFGIKVPRDVAVTGFDDIADAVNFEPRLSSVKRPRTEIGYRVCENLFNRIRGKGISTDMVEETRPVFRESCGCWIRCGKSFREFRHDYYVNRETGQSNSIILNEMMEKLSDCDNYDEMLDGLREYIPFLRCEGLYLCVNAEIFDRSHGIDSPELMDGLKKYGTDPGRAYSERMRILAAYRQGEYFEADDFDTDRLVPDCEYDGTARTYLFSPIHFQDLCLGYAVIVNPDYTMNGQPFYQWLMNVNISIENIRRKNTMNIALRRLEEMYIRDSLTNLYNRFGFEKYSVRLYNKSRSEKKSLMILFADLDKLKTINDEFGHENGDIAIRSVAKALIGSKRKEDICTRFGGDEFILMGIGYTAKETEELTERIHRLLADNNRKNNYPYQITASIGYFIIEPGSQISLQDAVDMADHNMYRVKRKYMEQV